ncbi:hypothetical protein AMS69_17990 [Haloarcula rubripromontorii]|uniref:Uncharacterized protein n=1 Tax=Haloarcula rubripromontorii TaxID=1705562 RepID=A0A0M9AGP2_9EURY|nr:hypothetical protein [Haloarcula rubripromontorii]KOX91612.1 hypothetical protein AMS69_17990 [Haloarcula rubripromontorii]
MGYTIDEYALHLAHAKAVQWYLREYPDVAFIDGSPKEIRDEVWTDPVSTHQLKGVNAGEEEFLKQRWDEYEALKGGDDA